MEKFCPHPLRPAAPCVGRPAAAAVLLLPAGHFPLGHHLRGREASTQSPGGQFLSIPLRPAGTTWCLWSEGTSGRVGPASCLTLLPPDHEYLSIDPIGQSGVILAAPLSVVRTRGAMAGSKRIFAQSALRHPCLVPCLSATPSHLFPLGTPSALGSPEAPPSPPAWRPSARLSLVPSR